MFSAITISLVPEARGGPFVFWENLSESCAQAAALGFDGKSLIHPSQVGPANAAFTPDAGAVAWARTVVAAFAKPEAADKGVLKVEGRMVERLHFAEAERLIGVADAIAARDG